METRDLEYVLLVWKLASIGKAADALGMTQPALTKAVRRVEDQLGVPLFERGALGVRPTAAGELFLIRAQRLQRDYDDALSEMRSIGKGEQGMISVGYSPSFSDKLLVAACRRLMRERPAAKLRIRCRLAQELLDLLRAGELDIALVPAPAEDHELHVDTLFHDQLIIVADAAHPLVGKEGVRLAELQGEEWLLPEASLPVRHMIEQAFVSRGLARPRLKIEADFSSPVLYQLIHGSQLLTLSKYGQMFLSTGLAQVKLQEGELDLDRRLGIITRVQGYLSPVCLRMIELLKEEVRRKELIEWL
ncbi:LysR family transcriptional regulator [Pseudomonas sp. Q1-7]|uniref:LysR family transcriptional regulator n=1 Tax=Pseudomonas sp. Q1-7 TaxID=3020843 RepID=UPI0022FFD6A6|nr:LysR family transcriptional regulator [Pseudomonas sp. Q1-7]